jgi:putative ABC transport system substrate-binding protein
MELLKEAIPKTIRVAALSNPDNPGHGPSLKEIELGARAWGMTLQSVAARSPNDFESAFGAAAKGRAGALFVMPDALFHSYLSRIVELAAKNRLPAMYDRPEFVEAGGLMSYAVNVADLSRRAAWYVDQILKGVKPADLPMVEPTKSELVINLKAAKQIGLTIPPEVLTRADKVIK